MAVCASDTDEWESPARPLYVNGEVSVDRRQFLGGCAALAACGPVAPPHPRGDVFAAGQPAALLTLALAPRRLLGWPRRPPRAALAMLPASADLPELGALSGGGAPANFEAMAALRPALVLDYGDTDAAYIEAAARVRKRIGVPYRLVDGALRRTPDALREAGALLGEPARADTLANTSWRILARWSAVSANGPSFYYARADDGLETGFRGALATEVLEGAGWSNVAEGARDIGRVAREQIAAWDPELIVTLDAGFAQTASGESFWRQRRGGGRRRMLLLPVLPFGWIDRPPSINRLLGCLCLSDRRLLDGDTARAIEPTRAFLRLFYGATPSDRRVASLAPRWLA